MKWGCEAKQGTSSCVYQNEHVNSANLSLFSCLLSHLGVCSKKCSITGKMVTPDDQGAYREQSEIFFHFHLDEIIFSVKVTEKKLCFLKAPF